MGLYIPGGVAGSGLSGKVGSVVGSHNRFGSYLRTLVIPTNPSSGPQTLARNRMSSLTNLWNNTLTAAQRAAWDTYASNVPVTNRIGQQIYLTGLNWYVACNSIRDQAGPGVPRVDAGPTVFNLASYEIIQTAISEATQLITTNFGVLDTWLDDEGALMLWATRPQNGSVNYNAQPYLYAGSIYGNTAVPPTSPDTTAVPFPVVQGQAVWVKYNCTQDDGRKGPPSIYRVIVSA